MLFNSYEFVLVFLPAAGLLYLDTYERQLLRAQEQAMVQQGRLLAAALAGPDGIDSWEADRILQGAIAEASGRLGPAGRVLVRPSGTEPALRVMVEGPDADLVTELADSLARVAGERLN